MDIQNLKKIIDGVGNIKVIFEPLVYDECLIQKNKLKEILEKSQVSLRGWNFPHIPNEDSDDGKRPYSIGNGVEFYTSWKKYQEIFRLYRSGQFLAKFALYEDTIGEVYGRKMEPGKYLDFLSLIYKITEITLFVKNLIENTSIKEGKIVIEINNTQDRELESIFSPNILAFNAGYVCHMNQVNAEINFNREKIAIDFLELSREIIKSIFDDFNWRTYSDSMIKTHQENLLNRRI